MATEAKLPDGWIVKQSKTYNRVYYFNCVTGESTWGWPNDAIDATNSKTKQTKITSLHRVETPVLPGRIKESVRNNTTTARNATSTYNGDRSTATSQRNAGNLSGKRKSLRQLCENINKEKIAGGSTSLGQERHNVTQQSTSQPKSDSSADGVVTRHNSQISTKQSMLARLSTLLEDKDIIAKILEKEHNVSNDARSAKVSNDARSAKVSNDARSAKVSNDARSAKVSKLTQDKPCDSPRKKAITAPTGKITVSPIKRPGLGKQANSVSKASAKPSSNVSSVSNDSGISSSSRKAAAGKPQKLRALIEKIEEYKTVMKKKNNAPVNILNDLNKRKKNNVADIHTGDKRSVVKVSNRARPPSRSVSVAHERVAKLRQQNARKKGINSSGVKEKIDKTLTVCAKVPEVSDDDVVVQGQNQNLFGWDSIHIVQPGEAGRKPGSVFSRLFTVAFKPQRGWPGEFKASNITEREVIAMDIDEVELPENIVDDHREEDMEVVMTEVRQEVKASLNQGHMGSSELASNEGVQPDTTEQTLVVVVDTNVLMADIAFLADLKDRDIEGFGRPFLFIPWIVLRELDKLKEDVRHGRPGLTKATQTKARAGINFLKGLLVKGHPRVLTQSPRQAEEATREFESCSNDETILQACLHAQKIYTLSMIVLLTNDNNLIVKSLASKVKAFNVIEFNVKYKAVISNIQKSKSTDSINRDGLVCQTGTVLNAETKVSQSPVPLVVSSSTGNQSMQILPDSQLQLDVTGPQLNSSYSKPGAGDGSGIRVPAIPTPLPSESGCVTDRLLDEEHCSSLENLVEDMYCKLRTVICKSFGKVLEVEMKLAFDDFWKQVILRKPPWTLRDVLDCWKKHWIAVFGMVLNRRLSNNVEKLRQAFFYHRGVTLELVKDISENALEILQECVLKGPKKYGDFMYKHKEIVTRIFELSDRLYLQLDKADSFPSLEEYLKAKALSRPTTPLEKPFTEMADKSDNVYTSETVTLSSSDPTQQQTVMLDVKLESSSCELKPVTQSNLLSEQTGPNEIFDSILPQPVTDSIGIIDNTLPQTVTGSSDITISVIHSDDDAVMQSSEDINQSEALKAGEVLQNIWQLTLKYCTQICRSVSGELTPDVQEEARALLQQLVPVAKDLRIPFIGLLEVPVQNLSQHEGIFIDLANQCNSFFTRLDVQDCPFMEPVIPLQLLVLYTHPQHRETLQEFGVKLDEMLCHLHRCIEILMEAA